MTFDWTPLPHLDLVEGIAYGEIVLNLLLLAGLLWCLGEFGKGFARGYRKTR